MSAAAKSTWLGTNSRREMSISLRQLNESGARVGKARTLTLKPTHPNQEGEDRYAATKDDCRKNCHTVKRSEDCNNQKSLRAIVSIAHGNYFASVAAAVAQIAAAAAAVSSYTIS